MKPIKRIIAVCLIGVLLLLCGCTESTKSTKSEQVSYPNPTAAFFVNDFADVVSAEDEETMCALGEALARRTTAQVVLCTVDTLGGQALETYSLELARTWGIGDKEKNNGVLILFAKQERRIRVEVGTGLEGDLPDGKTGRLMDVYAIDLLKENRFSEGLTALYEALVQEIYLIYGVETSDEYIPIDVLATSTETEEEGSVWTTLLAVLIVMGLIYMLRNRTGIGPFFFFGGFSGGGGSSGGGFGGGFSGGGGGFSGGGASRGF